MSDARTLPLRSRRAALAAATALALVALSGCGSSPSGTNASPATVTPASAPLYIDAVVRPSGRLRTDTLAAGRSVTRRAHPFSGLLTLLQRATGGRTLDYTRDVAPWLGPNAGLFVSAVGGGASAARGLLQELLDKGSSEGLAGAEATLLGARGLQSLLNAHTVQGALVLDTTDVDRARAFLKAQASSAGGRPASYRGVSYMLTSAGVAEGIVRRFAVVGSEAGVHSVIDTALGEPALARASSYAKLASTAEPGRLGDLYLAPQALGAATANAPAGASGAQSALPLLRGLLGDPGAAYLSLLPSAGKLALDVDTLPAAGATAAGGGAAANGVSGAQVLRGLPGSAWLALGVGDLGKTLGHSAQGLRALGALVGGLSFGGIGLGKLFAPLHSRALDVQRDLLSWMGATGVYASGSSVLSLQAAVIVTAKDPARARAALGKLASAYREAGGTIASVSVPGAESALTVRLPNVPLAVTLALADGGAKFVFGIAPASVQEALKPQSTLVGSSLYNAAASELGQGLQPSAAIEFRTLLGLIESLGLTQEPGFSSIVSALQPFGELAAGGGETLADGVKRARLALTLQSGA